MDWIGDAKDLVEAAGPVMAVVILLIIAILSMIIMFSKQINNLTLAISQLTDKVSSPHMDVERSLMIYRSIMRDHIWNKLEYLGTVLDNNHIKERQPQIKINIERELKRITVMEAGKLSKIKSVCGDMGKTLLKEVSWKKLLDPIYEIFFEEAPEDYMEKHNQINRKINDIHLLLNQKVDEIAEVIEENGIHN